MVGIKYLFGLKLVQTSYSGLDSPLNNGSKGGKTKGFDYSADLIINLIKAFYSLSVNSIISPGNIS